MHLSAAIARQPPTNGTLIDVMKLLHLQYDGVDWVARVVRYIVDLVQGDPAIGADGNVTDWAELLAVRPRTYLRMSLAMDLSMSSGRLPDKKDFLGRLDGVRLSRSARLLRSIAEPWEAAHVERKQLECAEDLRIVADQPLSIDTAALHSENLTTNNNNTTTTAAAAAPQTLQDLERADVSVDDATFADAFGTSDFSQEHSFSTTGDLGDFQSLSADLDDFFDPTMGEHVDTGESSGGSSSGMFEADLDIACLAG